MDLHDYVIVAMVEPQEVGKTFTEWPLHITLLPWFSAPNLEDVKAVCAKAVTGTKPFFVRINQRAYFGQRQLPVRLVEPIGEIMSLHNRLLGAVQANGWVMPGRYVGSAFKPHVTQKRGIDAEGQVLVDALYVVEKLGQGYRRIVAKLDL